MSDGAYTFDMHVEVAADSERSARDMANGLGNLVFSTPYVLAVGVETVEAGELQEPSE